MQAQPVKLSLLGKRTSSQNRTQSAMGMTEKHEPYEIVKKMRKKDKRKTIFQGKKYCSCTGKKKMCNLPKR